MESKSFGFDSMHYIFVRVPSNDEVPREPSLNIFTVRLVRRIREEDLERTLVLIILLKRYAEPDPA